MVARINASLTDADHARWKATGKPLAEVVRAGLDALEQPPAAPAVRDQPPAAPMVRQRHRPPVSVAAYLAAAALLGFTVWAAVAGHIPGTVAGSIATAALFLLARVTPIVITSS